MRTRATRPSLRLLLSVIATAAVAAGGLPLLVVSAADATTTQAPGYTLEVSDTDDLTDGQAIDVTLRPPPGGKLQFTGRAYICRADATYAVNQDLDTQRGNCPSSPVSSSGTTTPTLSGSPDGSIAMAKLQVGIGTVEWGKSDENPKEFSLTCDPANPCRLVVSIHDWGRNKWIVDSTTLLTFSYGDTGGSCVGADPSAITTNGAERLNRSWVSWTKAACTAGTGLSPTQAVFTGEEKAQTSMAAGSSDLVYSAVGPTFERDGTAPPRATTSVPLALNATVIGVLGGYGNVAPDWPLVLPKPFTDLQATWAEMATLFGASPYVFTTTYKGAMDARNPELAKLGESGGLMNGLKSAPLAPSSGDAVTWFATQGFDTLAGEQWKMGPVSATPYAPRGVHASLSKAEPPFSIGDVELYSAQGQLKRLVVSQFTPGTYGPIWVLTDLATAREMGMTTVALPNSSGAFVQPTEESLLAAAADLELQADGTYLPTIGAGGSDSPGAYPLTFVEHAVAPTEPLLDATCAPRTGSQQVLADWLTFLTGPGQELLADGLVPLPDEMRTQAATARAAIGTATTTGTCAEAVPVVAPTTVPGTPSPIPPGRGSFPDATSTFDPGGGSFGSPSSSSSSASGGSSGSFGAGATGAADVGTVGADGIAGTADDEVAIAEIAYPSPTDGQSNNGWATGLALVVLAVLIAVGGFLSSGRRPNLASGARS